MTVTCAAWYVIELEAKVKTVFSFSWPRASPSPRFPALRELDSQTGRAALFEMHASLSQSWL